MGRGTIVGNIVNSVLGVVGLGGHNETFTDIQISNLLTVGIADSEARKAAKRGAYGDMYTYFLSYRSFQQEYKRKYSKKFLQNVGYLPSSTASTRVIIDSMVATYLQTAYNYTSVNILGAVDKYLTESDKCTYGMQQLAGYQFPTGTVLENSKYYQLTSCVETTAVDLDYVLTRYYVDTITEYLTSSYSYDSGNGTVVIGGELYSVGILSAATNSNDEYEVVCSHIPQEYIDSVVTASSTGGITASLVYIDDVDASGKVEVDEVTNSSFNIQVTPGVGASVGDTLDINVDGNVDSVVITQSMLDNGYLYSTTTYTTAYEATLPDQTLSVAADRISRSYSNSLFSGECTYVKYTVTSGEVDVASRYFLAKADMLNVYQMANVAVTTIIPMKENNAIVSDSYKLSRVLKKLGLTRDQLLTSLDNPDMDAAYLMTGLDPRVDNSAHNKLMFQMFDLMVTGNGNVTVSINHLSMKYTFTVNRNTVQGSIGAVGTYSRAGFSSTGIKLYRQGSATEYQIITISNFSQRYTISGQTISTGFNTDKCRLVIPLDLFNKLKYKEWVDVYERSLCMLGYATKTVYIEWYETAIFGFILKVVAIALTVSSLGAASSIGAALTKLAVAFVVSKVITAIAVSVGGSLGMLLAVVATVIAYQQGFLGDFDGTTEAWLQVANSSLNTINQVIEHEISTITAEGTAALSYIQDKIDEVKEKNKEYENDNVVMPHDFASFGKPNPMFQSIEEYVNSIVNTESLVDGSWLYDIEAQINQRNQVYVG